MEQQQISAKKQKAMERVKWGADVTVKNISTRAKICGRSAKCKGGHSAVEQASYISREKMYCEYDGQTY